MKVLDSPALVASVKQRSKDYKNVKEQMIDLRKSFKGVSTLVITSPVKAQIMSRTFIRIWSSTLMHISIL